MDRPFDDADYEALDAFLLSDDSPEDVMDISMLHGYLTAVLTGPLIMPSRWMPAVWGAGRSGEHTSLEQARQIMSLLMRFYNDIAGWLLDDLDTFEPLFYESRLTKPPAIIVDDWCGGYMRGVELCHDDWSWLLDDPKLNPSIAPIRFAVFSTNAEFDKLARNRKSYNAFVQDVEAAPRLIYRQWREREELMP